MYSTRKIIPSDYAAILRDYERGNLDEAELSAELTALGYTPFEIERQFANLRRRSGSKGGPKWMKS